MEREIRDAATEREEAVLDFVSPSSGPNLSPKTSEEEARERGTFRLSTAEQMDSLERE